MEPLLFKHPHIHKWDPWLVTLLGFLVLWPIVGLFYYGYMVLGIVFFILWSPYLLLTVWRVRHIAEKVMISDKQIEASWPNGKRVSLRWDQVSELRQFNAKLYFKIVKIVRLISVDHQEIVITDLMDNFEELMAQVKTKAPHVHIKGKLNFWERIIRWL